MLKQFEFKLLEEAMDELGHALFKLDAYGDNFMQKPVDNVQAKTKFVAAFDKLNELYHNVKVEGE